MDLILGLAEIARQAYIESERRRREEEQERALQAARNRYVEDLALAETRQRESEERERREREQREQREREDREQRERQEYARQVVEREMNWLKRN